MPCWPRLDRLALVLALLTAGCARAPGLSVVAVDTRLLDAPELVLKVNLPARVRAGLERGVPLSFRLDVRQDNQHETRIRELRYLPLSQQYQLREAAIGYSRGYDSRAAALAALERWPLPHLVGQGPLQVRVRLDHTRLPAPLVLPALFDRDWRLDSGRQIPGERAP